MVTVLFCDHSCWGGCTYTNWNIIRHPTHHYTDTFFFSLYLSHTQDSTVSLHEPWLLLFGCICLHKSKQTHTGSMWVTGGGKNLINSVPSVASFHLCSITNSLPPPPPTLSPPSTPSPFLWSCSPPPGLSVPAAVLISDVGSHLLIVADGVWEGHPEAPHGPQSLLQLGNLCGGVRKSAMTQTGL